LLQMQGTAHEVVVLHHEWAVTKQMQQDRLACKVKIADNINIIKIYYRERISQDSYEDSLEKD